MPSPVASLIEILSWQRGANTKSHETFCNLHIATIPDIQRDEYGNFHLLIGDDDPAILWSSHTDTVTHREGRQNITWVDKDTLGLHKGKVGQCLGADDGAGIWLMMELIKAQVPGYYVFHADEEIGGLGSSYLKDNPQYFPPTIKFAIAMDRCGTKDVITHQGFSRCCSDAFAKSLAAQLPSGYIPDDTGVFTDTANYIGLFSECTNLSVGYERNHGPMETLNVTHLLKLRDALLKIDPSKLVCERDPTEEDYTDMFMSYPSISMSHGAPTNKKVDQEIDYAGMIQAYPGIAVRLFNDLGVSAEEYRAHLFAIRGVLWQD